MSAVNITNVTMLDNPALFLAPFHFAISYECVTPLKDGPGAEPLSSMLEVLTAQPTNPSVHHGPTQYPKNHVDQMPCVVSAFLPLLFWGREFVRVGYYVNNDFEDEQLREETPQKVRVDKVPRTILSDKPRSTKFPINFHPENSGSKEQSTTLEHPAEIKVDGEEPFDLPTRAGEANAEKPEL